MRPVTRNTDPSYKIPDEITISRSAIREYFDAEGFPKRTTTIYYSPRILKWMLDAVAANKGKSSWSGLNFIEQSTMVYLIKNVFTDGKNTGYGNSRLSLILNYSQYCSYCGMPVYDHSLAVEHMLPKSAFADVMMCYPNFLLACPNCNSNKGANPSYAEAKAQAGGSTPTYIKIKAGGYARYIWPDNTPLNNTAYSAFTLSLKRLMNDDVWEPFAPDRAYSLENRFLRLENNEVNAYIGGPSPGGRYIRSEYSSVNPAAQRMVDTLSLNNNEPNDTHMSDRRMINRTIAFLEAIQAFKRIQDCYNALNASFGTPAIRKVFDDFCVQVMITARYSGFYEVWVDVINYLSPAGSTIAFYTTFKNATTDAGNINAYFPGTDASRLP